MAKERIYTGKIPDASDGWEHIAKLVCDEGISWMVFEKAQEHSQDWCTYKVIAESGAPRKASYWLVRNVETRQIGFARDYAIMRSTRPSLHVKVERVLDSR